MSERRCEPKSHGPSLRETFLAQQIATFLEGRPELREWVAKMVETQDGLDSLKLLVCAALSAHRRRS